MKKVQRYQGARKGDGWEKSWEGNGKSQKTCAIYPLKFKFDWSKIDGAIERFYIPLHPIRPSPDEMGLLSPKNPERIKTPLSKAKYVDRF